jgi:hypothetical protein
MQKVNALDVANVAKTFGLNGGILADAETLGEFRDRGFGSAHDKTNQADDGPDWVFK